MNNVVIWGNGNPNRNVVIKNEVAKMVSLLTNFEVKLVRLFVAQLDDKKLDPDNMPTLHFNADECYELLGITGMKHRMSKLRRALKQASEKSFWYWKNPSTEAIGRWLDTAEINHHTNEVEVTFHRTCIDYITAVDKYFLKYGYKMIQNFRGDHTIPLFELLYTQNGHANDNGTWFFRIPFEDLRGILGLVDKERSKNQYPMWGNFNQRVLTPSVDEINLKSRLTVDWEVVKKRSKVVDIIFHITDPDKAKQKKPDGSMGPSKSEQAAIAEEKRKIRSLRKKVKAIHDEDLQAAIQERHGEVMQNLLKVGVPQTQELETIALDKVLLQFEEQIKKGSL